MFINLTDKDYFQKIKNVNHTLQDIKQLFKDIQSLTKVNGTTTENGIVLVATSN